MLPSVESLNLADADVGQRMGRTSCSRSAERFCCLSIPGPSILLFYFSHLLWRVKVILDYSLVLLEFCILQMQSHLFMLHLCLIVENGKGGPYEGS